MKFWRCLIMAEKNKKENSVNIYELAGKVGKKVKQYGGYIVAGVMISTIIKGPDLIKKVKK